ncbi:MAG: cell division protein DedD [Sodalis sp. Psp]|nr:cell division protein DedD [Sodalis sp. Psp]MCR3757069.1 cell division protein DedD [Sodalis sp. Ppy]
MASKFQNRLVGTIVLVALGVIILPSLLDGKKKHYQDKFVTIPLMLKPSDNNTISITLPDQQLPSQSPKGIEQERKRLSSPIPSQQQLGNDIVAQQSVIVRNSDATGDKIPPTARRESQSASKSKAAAEQAPEEETWVVQLGALKNAGRVAEIVAKLRLFGYHIYTLPSVPVQGQVTRIFVGPDAYKGKLQDLLGELNQLSGLNGQLRSYSVR